MARAKRSHLLWLSEDDERRIRGAGEVRKDGKKEERKPEGGLRSRSYELS